MFQLRVGEPCPPAIRYEGVPDVEECDGTDTADDGRVIGVSPRPIRTSSRTRSRELQPFVLDEGTKITIKEPSGMRPSKGRSGPFPGPPGRIAKSMRKPAKAKPTKPTGDAANAAEVLLAMGVEHSEVF